jgi:aryl-alcohol dehydrogenase-like predicted oxidoreductase
MRTRTIGGVQVGEVGLGAMHFGTAAELDDDRSVRCVHDALDAEVTLIDTALCYTPPGVANHSERIVAQALRTHPRGQEALVATKGGHHRDGAEFVTDGRPETIRKHCELSLAALGVERLGLYQMHWPDPQVPLAETVGAFAQLREEGKIAMVGLSNVTLEQLREAQAIVAIASVQNPFNPMYVADRPLIAACAQDDIAYLPWAPLIGNHAHVPAIRALAAERGVSEQSVTVAWHLAQGPNVIPIPGTRHGANIVDCVGGSGLELTAEELALLP